MDIEKSSTMSYSEALESMEDWRKLTELQKKIIYTHVSNPNWTKTEVARCIGCSFQNVYSLFHSKYFEKINTELAKLEKRELLQLALKALKECLSSETQQVKLSAAVKVLSDADVLKDSGKEKEQEIIKVIWGSEDKDANSKNTIQPPPKTEASLVILSKI